MEIGVFTEGSATTDDSADTYLEHFAGSFLTINEVVTQLQGNGPVEIHILSEKYGYVLGSDSVGESPIDVSDAVDSFMDALSSRASELDVVIIQLRGELFERAVSGVWDQIVADSKQGSIWCIATSSKAMRTVNLDRLSEKVNLFMYERRGVARISTEIQEELYQAVDSY